MRLIDADALLNLPFESMIHTDYGETAIPIEEIETAPTVNPKELKPLVDKIVEILPELTDAIIKELPKMVSGEIKCSECSFYKNTWNIIPGPQGEWIRKYNGHRADICCTNCGYDEGYSCFKYCPNCGAKMKGGAEE